MAAVLSRPGPPHSAGADAEHVPVRSAVRTEIRKFRETVAAGDKAAAEKQLRVASRALDKSVSKGVFHRNNAANKKSNMARALNKLG